MGQIELENALQNVKKKEESQLNYISTYNGQAKLVQSLKKKAWHVLQNYVKYGKLFNKLPRFIYRKEKSIGDHLVRTDVAPKRYKSRYAYPIHYKKR